METREWNCGTQCEMWGVPLVCLFHNPILVSIVAPLELGLGIHNPRFVAGPLELGLGTRNARSTMINRSTVFALHCFVLPCVPIKMQGVGLLGFTLGYSTTGVFLRWGPMQRVHRKGSQVLSECCKVGYSATLARAHVHRLICSENRSLPSLGDLCREVI